MNIKSRKNKKYHYFYKITNLINQHYYYGIHSTNNINDGYMGSGKRLLKSFEKYGIENFQKEILRFFETREEASDYESEIVTEELIRKDECYNIIVGGDFLNSTNLVTIYDPESCTYKDIPIEEFRNNKEKYVTYSTGKVFCRRKSDGEHVTLSKEEFRANKDKYEGFTASKVLCKGTNGKIFMVNKDNPAYLDGTLKPIWFGKKHSPEYFEKIRKKFKEINHQKGEKNSQYGTCWIHNNECSKSIKKSELEIYLAQGWIKGRKMKF